MSVEQLERQIQQLAPEDRRKFAEWFDDHRHELLPVPAAQEREVMARLREMEESPALLEPFELSDVDRLFKEFGNARAQKTPPRRR